MRLTRFTDYSLRVLIYLGLKQDQRVTIRRISGAYGISKNHLMKVVSGLTRMGYLNAQRGPGGGIRLAQPPEQINLAEVIKYTEGDLMMVECLDGEENCPIAPVCNLQFIIGEALGAFFRTLKAYTLKDLIEPQKDLSSLFKTAEEAASTESV